MEAIENMKLEDIAARNEVNPKNLQDFLETLKKSMEIAPSRILVNENGKPQYYIVELKGVGRIKTNFGYFWQYDFRIDDDWEKYSVLVKARIDKSTFLPVFKNNEELVLRTDSGCETGQVFGDLTCECKEQLELAMKNISDEGEGMIVHIPRQDGRGMGLPFKLATLWLQDEFGVNTVEAASLLASGGDIDVRTYSGVICILKFFGISCDCHIKLATNNPQKAKVFIENGYKLNGGHTQYMVLA